MNEYLNPIFQGLDPDEELEEEYKKKNDPTFCWKFLRAASFLPYNFKEGTKEGRIGNVEHVAMQIHQQSEKRPINKRQKVAEEEKAAAATSNVTATASVVAA